MAENTKQFRGSCVVFFLCVCERECVRYRDWHKPSVFRAWSNSFNGLPAVHSKVWFCSAEWEQKKKKIPNNLLCCLCLASLVIVCNLFPTLGYCEPFFSIFQWLTFFFCLDPARCWLNSCLQPWCWNITENYIIILKLVNKERQRNRFKSQGTMLHEELLTSLTQM